MFEQKKTTRLYNHPGAGWVQEIRRQMKSVGVEWRLLDMINVINWRCHRQRYGWEFCIQNPEPASHLCHTHTHSLRHWHFMYYIFAWFLLVFRLSFMVWKTHTLSHRIEYLQRHLYTFSLPHQILCLRGERGFDILKAQNDVTLTHMEHNHAESRAGCGWWIALRWWSIEMIE